MFTERLPDFLEASSRLTKRLRTAVQEIGFATGGKGGEHLSDKLGIPISEASVLCALFLVPLRCRLPPLLVQGNQGTGKANRRAAKPARGH